MKQFLFDTNHRSPYIPPEKNDDYKKHAMKYEFSHPAKWRDYQSKLQRTSRLKHLLKNLSLLLAVSACAVIILITICWAVFRPPAARGPAGQKPPQSPQPGKKPDSQPLKLSRDDLPAILEDVTRDTSMLSDVFVCEKAGMHYTVRTTIDTKLQSYILKLLGRSRTLQAAVVVLNAADGAVIAMADHDSNENGHNLNLKADYPAASLFKIISAAAALENSGFTPDTVVNFVGRRHTLYKSQLKQTKNRWTTETTLRKAFALSNNSVFGKLGIYVLGQTVLEEYAEKFAFNRLIPFDLPLAVSSTVVPSDDFGLAEIASGFNKKTLISPLHATLLATVPANAGIMPVPWLVDTVADGKDQVLYHADPGVWRRPVSGDAAKDLTILMEDAARYGTSRSAFRRLRRRRLFQTFEMGAKTGTINDRTDSFKYDWITAFALAPDGNKGIAVGVLGVHGKILGTRSTELARAIIDYYFRM
jgi:peptidoglycan glycosyltransferase